MKAPKAHEATPVPSLNDPLERALYILKEPVIIINRKKIVTYLNKSAMDKVQNQTGRLMTVGASYLDFVHPSRKSMAVEQIDDALCNQVTEFTINYPQSGTDTFFQLGYYPMPDETGLVTHVCVRARDITRQVMLEKELENERERQKFRLIRATIEAQEKQRSEIGRELHDNVNQVLTTVKLYNELCLTEEYTNKNLLLRSVQQVNYCIETLRTLSRTLASPSVDETNIRDAISELVDEINETKRIHARFMTYGMHADKISQDQTTTLYRIAQEQLTNVLKYAGASTVDVLLVGTSVSIALSIQDDGCGFNLEEKRKGIGLTNMITRAEALGGHIEIITAPGKGCSLMVEFPLSAK